MKKAIVLVVDDEVGIVEGLKSWLEIDEHTVYTAHSGIEALDVLKDQEIDIMITDLRMPKMGGLELLSKIESIKHDVCSIVLTGHGDLANAIEALNRGAAAYMQKPVDLDELGIHFERCLAQVELKRQLVFNLERLNDVLGCMVDALMVISPEGVLQMLNQPACTMMGYSEKELLGKSFGTFFMEGVFSGDGLKTLLDKGSFNSIETTLLARDGRHVPVLISGSIRRSGGRVSGAVLVAKDITDYQQAQQSLREREAQLVHTSRLTAMGEMAAGIAHELNQPLAVMRIWSQSLGNDVTRGTVSKERVFEATQEIDQQMIRATTIITHMRAFARGETDEPAEPTDLAVPANEALLFFREQFRIHEIELVLEIVEGLPKVCIHASRFEQIVVNLISNARYAVDKKPPSSSGKRIELRLFSPKEGCFVVLEVVDNGMGMSEEERRRCLDPFFTTKEEGQGTGLGLHIVCGIVHELKGRVEVESQPDQGALFRVVLPAV